MLPALVVSLCIGAQGTARPLELGVDRFLRLYADSLAGKRIAVLTHAAAHTSSGELSAQALRSRFHVVAFWAPEHGFWGAAPAGAPVPDTTFEGVPVYSLYGPRRRPPEQWFDSIDAVVVDLQDAGFRAYTYISTLYWVLDACAAAGKPVYVLDRPNPLGGVMVEGAVLDTALRSFVGIAPIPYVHGCTIGELAQLFVAEGWLPRAPNGRPRRPRLTVVPMQGWRRSMLWEDTGLHWTPPSPNLPTPVAARAAVVTGILGELGLYSVGIGTDAPFQYLGAPEFPAESLLAAQQRLAAVGIEIRPAEFIPTGGRFAGQRCRGIFLQPTSSRAQLFAAFLELAQLLHRLRPDWCSRLSSSARQMLPKVLGQRQFFEDLCNGASLERWHLHGVVEFLAKRERVLLYPP
jgi:uncharacterized protein YbbC (DUF1343 family)